MSPSLLLIRSYSDKPIHGSDLLEFYNMEMPASTSQVISNIPTVSNRKLTQSELILKSRIIPITLSSKIIKKTGMNIPFEHTYTVTGKVNRLNSFTTIGESKHLKNPKTFLNRVYIVIDIETTNSKITNIHEPFMISGTVFFNKEYKSFCVNILNFNNPLDIIENLLILTVSEAFSIGCSKNNYRNLKRVFIYAQCTYTLFLLRFGAIFRQFNPDMKEHISVSFVLLMKL